MLQSVAVLSVKVKQPGTVNSVKVKPGCLTGMKAIVGTGSIYPEKLNVKQTGAESPVNNAQEVV
jgi:hypothetical protein